MKCASVVSALPAADGVDGVPAPDVELLAQRYQGHTGIHQAEATLGLADEGAGEKHHSRSLSVRDRLGSPSSIGSSSEIPSGSDGSPGESCRYRTLVLR
jgi:hypothetical protein